MPLHIKVTTKIFFVQSLISGLLPGGGTTQNIHRAYSIVWSLRQDNLGYLRLVNNSAVEIAIDVSRNWIVI